MLAQRPHNVLRRIGEESCLNRNLSPTDGPVVTAEIQPQPVPRAATLDHGALADLYRAHAAVAQRAAYAVTRNGPDAEDATSEAIVRILTALAADRLGSDIRWGPYFRTASRNAAVDLHRSSRCWLTGRHDDLDQEAEAPLPGSGLLAQADAELVLQAFRDLPGVSGWCSYSSRWMAGRSGRRGLRWDCHPMRPLSSRYGPGPGSAAASSPLRARTDRIA